MGAGSLPHGSRVSHGHQPRQRRLVFERKRGPGLFALLLARSRFDVNREPNNGRGPVDFKLSEGSADMSLIEFKLAKSTSLKRNLQRQLTI
jgi:hypothetical protein